MPDVDRLGRLAGEQAERRQVAERVAGEEGGEGVADPQPGVGRGAQRPGPGPDEQAEPGQQDDDQEAPADALHAGDDLVQPGLPQSQGEQRRAEQRSRDAPRRDPPALAFARLGPAAVVHAHARDRVPRRSPRQLAFSEAGARRGAVYNRPVLPAVYQLPAAVLLLGGGLLACFVGQRLFRVVLGIYGFVTGALIAATIVGPSTTGTPILAMLAGGAIGALVLILAYFVGVALVGAALGAVVVHLIAAQLAREPHPVVVILGTVVGAVAAMALQRYVIIVATAFGGAWTALVGAISMIGSRAAQVTDGWVLYPLRVPVGHEWMWVGWIVLGGIGAAVQLSNRPRTAKR